MEESYEAWGSEDRDGWETSILKKAKQELKLV